MMFECIDKIYPSVSIETLTGSIVSFNDEYGGLPLKSCTSLITGYQEGSGTPSPSNPRNLVSFSSATLTENGNTHLFTFGQSIYHGSIDWEKGVVVGNIAMVDLGSLSWTYHSVSGSYSAYFDAYLPNDSIVGDSFIPANIITSIYETIRSMDIAISPYDNNVIALANNTRRLIICDTRYTDANVYKTAMNGVYLAYELATPIEIPLGGINLLTQEGQNNIFCDTGDTTVEYIKIV